MSTHRTLTVFVTVSNSASLVNPSFGRTMTGPPKRWLGAGANGVLARCVMMSARSHELEMSKGAPLSSSWPIERIVDSVKRLAASAFRIDCSVDP